MFAPAFLGEGFLADGLEVGERASEGALGLGFVTVQEIDAVELIVGPMDGVGSLGMESGLAAIESAVTAGEEPAGVDGFGDDVRVLRGGGLVSDEGFVEFAVVVGGIFARDEEGFGGSAVTERVEAGDGVGVEGRRGCGGVLRVQE